MVFLIANRIAILHLIATSKTKEDRESFLAQYDTDKGLFRGNPFNPRSDHLGRRMLSAETGKEVLGSDAEEALKASR